VSQHRLAGKEGARFSGTVAHRNHDIPGPIDHIIDAARPPPGPFNARFTQNLDGIGVHPGGRL
jgi:hypothetical protein